MSHFYAGISGQAGEATRQGSKGSGISGYVQGWMARLHVSINHVPNCQEPYSRPDHDAEKNEGDIGHITLTGGPSGGYGSHSLGGFNVNNVVAALDSNDPKINAIWERIQKDFRKLDAEAVPAIVRVERKRKAAMRKEQRERAAAAKRRREIQRDLTPTEKAHISRVLPFAALDEQGNYDERSQGDLERSNLRTDGIGHVILDIYMGWRFYEFDATDGVWLLTEYDEAEMGDERLGFGHRIINTNNMTQEV